MKKLWEWIKTNVGKAATVVWHALTTAGKAIARAFTAAVGWMKAHLAVTITVAAVVVLSLGLGLGLGLTLPVKSVEVEGEVFLLRGEGYKSGFTIKQTTRAGLVHREPVVPSMLSEFDVSEGGDKEAVVTYKGWQIPVRIKVVAESELTLRLRNGSLPAEYEPGDEFSKSGIFDLYYNGECIRSAPVTKKSASGFTSRLSGDYTINLTYRPGLSVEYSYTVLEVIDHIDTFGVVYVKQGAAFSKQSVIGNVRLHVFYKDGAEEDVMIYDDGVFIVDGVAEERDEEYDGEISFSYKGVEVSHPVFAYQGDLLSPKKVSLHLGSLIYAVGETFDFEGSYLEVEYERFSTPVLLRSTPDTIVFMERTGEPENYVLTPITTGILPFAEVHSYAVIAEFLGVRSEEQTIRVISEEDAARITSLSTAWRGTQAGAPNKGEDLDFEGAMLTVERGFGYDVAEVPLTEEMVEGYDKNVAGDQEWTITYEDYVWLFPVRIKDPSDPSPTRIIQLSGWNKSTYYSSNELVVPEDAHLVVEIGYGVSVDEIYIKDNEDVAITGFTPHSLDPQDITITYRDLPPVILEGFTVIDDREKELSYISMRSYSLHIDVGAGLDYDTIICVLGYNSEEDNEEEISLADLVDLGATVYLSETFDKNKPGTYDMMISYNGHSTSWIALYVDGDPEITLLGLVLDVSEAKTTYRLNEELSLDGMKLYLEYSDYSREDVTDDLSPTVFYGFSTASVGNFTATVMHLDSNEATEFNYTVIE